MSLTRAEALPDGKVRFHLAEPVLEHGRPVSVFTLRPPTLDEQLRIGDPVTWVTSLNGGAMRVVERDILRRLFDVLIEGADADFMARATDLRLGHLIEETILGFFQKARTEPAPASGS